MGESTGTVVATTTFFLASLVLTVVALVTPSWILQDFQGETTFGLFEECVESNYGSEKRTRCRTATTPTEWRVTSAIIILGAAILTVAVVYAILSYRRSRYLKYSKWLAFASSSFFSLACLILPVGFNGDPIGGEPYKLPEDTNIGFSYILFIVALLLIFIGELFAMKVLCPM